MTERKYSFQSLLELSEQPRVSSIGILAVALKQNFVNVPLGQTGVLIRGCGQSSERERVDESLILPPGTYGIGYKERIVAVDTGRKLFDEEYYPETSEGVSTLMAISMYYHLRPQYTPIFYKTYNSVDFENMLLRPCLKSCIEQVIGSTSINNFATKEQAVDVVGQPLQQLIKQMADGIGMDYTNLCTRFTPPRWQREFVENLASQRLDAEITEIQRKIVLLNGDIEAMIVQKKHKADEPTEADLALARIQSGAGELKEKFDFIQQLLVSLLSH